MLKMEQNPVSLSTISFAKLEKERNSKAYIKFKVTFPPHVSCETIF